ncbi:hypothetical protein VCUG_01710 [Vavraia culicis subsp. floridensis]|uniref:Uncharacterized protein n=1 Tax=Vavraia culicis (isolate floridensis) TaxID=948595 RepID=L2GUN1_VAVCU|nr:uncharacterized protein VCUG_01710 [Vavraia culicis subsp. floridensis]ELA46810.1 hypothetical protein VCUG_01710 [Vavraia culicis subsp. floridensis]
MNELLHWYTLEQPTPFFTNTYIFILMNKNYENKNGSSAHLLDVLQAVPYSDCMYKQCFTAGANVHSKCTRACYSCVIESLTFYHCHQFTADISSTALLLPHNEFYLLSLSHTVLHLFAYNKGSLQCCSAAPLSPYDLIKHFSTTSGAPAQLPFHLSNHKTPKKFLPHPINGQKDEN